MTCRWCGRADAIEVVAARRGRLTTRPTRLTQAVPSAARRAVARQSRLAGAPGRGPRPGRGADRRRAARGAALPAALRKVADFAPARRARLGRQRRSPPRSSPTTSSASGSPPRWSPSSRAARGDLTERRWTPTRRAGRAGLAGPPRGLGGVLGGRRGRVGRRRPSPRRRAELERLRAQGRRRRAGRCATPRSQGPRPQVAELQGREHHAAAQARARPARAERRPARPPPRRPRRRPRRPRRAAEALDGRAGQGDPPAAGPGRAARGRAAQSERRATRARPRRGHHPGPAAARHVDRRGTACAASWRCRRPGAPGDRVEAALAAARRAADADLGRLARAGEPGAARAVPHLPRARLIVDGYNVSKTAWPTSSLEAQRHRLLNGLAPAGGPHRRRDHGGLRRRRLDHRGPSVSSPARGARCVFSPRRA